MRGGATLETARGTFEVKGPLAGWVVRANGSSVRLSGEVRWYREPVVTAQWIDGRIAQPVTAVAWTFDDGKVAKDNVGTLAKGTRVRAESIEGGLAGVRWGTDLEKWGMVPVAAFAAGEPVSTTGLVGGVTGR